MHLKVFVLLLNSN